MGLIGAPTALLALLALWYFSFDCTSGLSVSEVTVDSQNTREPHGAGNTVESSGESSSGPPSAEGKKGSKNKKRRKISLTLKGKLGSKLKKKKSRKSTISRNGGVRRRGTETISTTDGNLVGTLLIGNTDPRLDAIDSGRILAGCMITQILPGMNVNPGDVSPWGVGCGEANSGVSEQADLHSVYGDFDGRQRQRGGVESEYPETAGGSEEGAYANYPPPNRDNPNQSADNNNENNNDGDTGPDHNNSDGTGSEGSDNSNQNENNDRNEDQRDDENGQDHGQGGDKNNEETGEQNDDQNGENQRPSLPPVPPPHLPRREDPPQNPGTEQNNEETSGQSNGESNEENHEGSQSLPVPPVPPPSTPKPDTEEERQTEQDGTENKQNHPQFTIQSAKQKAQNNDVASSTSSSNSRLGRKQAGSYTRNGTAYTVQSM